MKEITSEQINNEISAFHTFENFKNAVLNLPEEFYPPFLKTPEKQKLSPELTLMNLNFKGYENIILPNDEEIIEEAENESSDLRTIRTATALKELYKMTNGIINNNTTAMGTDTETSLRLFHDEIFSLWEKRKEKEPINLTSFCAIKIKNLEKESQELEKRKINAEKEKQEILNKTKVMGPKKRESYLKSQANNLYDLEKTIEGSENMIKYTKESIKKLEINIKKELLAKKILNAKMPYLSGNEYFESYMDSLNSVFRNYTKEKRNKFEDVLLEWALKYQDYPPLKKQKKEETSKKQITELNPFQKKLLNELWRVYPVVEQNPSEDNLYHANLIYLNFLRLLEK